MKPPKPTDQPMPRALAYPQGWSPDKSYGQLQCDATKAGRLARLADVAHFVMEHYDLPPSEATAWLCDSIEAASPELYLLSESGRARLITPEDRFDSPMVILGVNLSPPDVANCGLPGAVKHMRQYWDSETPGKSGWHGEGVLDPLAIRLDDAFSLWGYGSLDPAHRAVGEVRPLELWKLDNTPYGFMAFDQTSSGRLVRLADIVRWIEADKVLPRLQAVDALCAGLDAGALGVLYQVRPGDYAERKPANHTYGYLTVSQANAAQRKGAIAARGGSGWSAVPTNAAWSATQWGNGDSRPAGPWPSNGGNSKRQSQPTPVAPGLPALVRRIRETWGAAVRKGAGDVLDANTGELAALALPVDTAYSLFGWGSVAQVVQLISVPNANVEVDIAPSKATSYDWGDVRTQAALLAAFEAAPGKSNRAKAVHLATTEKWGVYSAETLRSKVSVFQKNGGGMVKSKDADLSRVWGNTQRKS